jgi:hypothetical protein
MRLPCGYLYGGHDGSNQPILNTMAAATATVNINNNTIRGFSVVSTGQVTAVSNQAAAVGVAINIKIIKSEHLPRIAIPIARLSADAFVPIFNSNGAATALLTITGNDVRGIVNNVTGTGAHPLHSKPNLYRISHYQ